MGKFLERPLRTLTKSPPRAEFTGLRGAAPSHKNFRHGPDMKLHSHKHTQARALPCSSPSRRVAGFGLRRPTTLRSSGAFGKARVAIGSLCRRFLVLISICLLPACRREDRNFTQGGPTHPARVEQQPGNRGPEAEFERNAFALSEGKRLFSKFNCVGCHANGGGDIGPALRDVRWIYGGSFQNVLTSILDGRPNGMPAFRKRITEDQARQIAAYVRSLSGQAPQNAATSRSEHMKTAPAENSVERLTPKLDPKPSP